MAVKPITNNFPVQNERINRAEQKTTKNNTNRPITNREQVVEPGGYNFGKNYKIDLKDLDSIIFHHINNVMKIRVNENNELLNVPLIYGNEERWANFKKHGVIRDKNESLMLPLMMFKRSSVDFNNSLPSYKHDIKKDFVGVVRNSSYSSDNRYTRFSVQTGALSPTTESIVTGLPEYVDVNYEFILFTQYMTQMNSIIELFVEQSNTYWGDNTSYKFLCNVESITDASEVSLETERAVKNTFTLTLKGYLIPEFITNVINKKTSQAKIKYSKSRIVFNENII